MKYILGVIVGGLFALSIFTVAFACSGSHSKSVGVSKPIASSPASIIQTKPKNGS